MPRVSRKQTELHHDQIEAAASRLFRVRGIHGIGVAELMKAVGLTHGSFYGHFASKEALAAAAAGNAFARSRERWADMLANAETPAAGRAAIIARYLSDAAVADPGTSCPATAFAVDVGREPADSPVRAAFAEGLNALIAVLAASLAEEPDDETAARGDALAMLASLVGALALARATAGTQLSDEIRASVGTRLAATWGSAG